MPYRVVSNTVEFAQRCGVYARGEVRCVALDEKIGSGGYWSADSYSADSTIDGQPADCLEAGDRRTFNGRTSSPVNF
jgi:hypothetical protein